MTKIKKTNPLSYLMLAVLSVALIAALILVKQNQDSRRGAYFAGTDLFLTPDVVESQSGDTFSVKIFVDTGKVGTSTDSASVDYVKSFICFGDKVTIETEGDGDITSKIRIGDKFSNVLIGRLEADQTEGNTNLCANIEIKAEKPQAQLGKGLIEVGTVEFKAVSEGTENIVVVKDKSLVTGFNPDPTNTDAYLQIGNVAGTVVNIGQAASKWSKNSCDPATGRWGCTASVDGEYGSLTDCQEASGCQVEGSGGYNRTGCNQTSGQYNCVLVETNADYATEAECKQPDANCVVANKWAHGSTAASCNTSTGAWTCVQVADGTFTSRESCEADTGCDIATIKYSRGSCNTATGKYVCNQSSSGQYSTVAECEAGGTECRQTTDWPVLNYKITYAGVKNSNECATNWPLAITVRKGDLVKTYNHTPIPDGQTTGGLRVYRGSLALTDFGADTGLSVFIKGPRHLQVKYAKNGQDAFYNLPGGEINLTRVASTSQVNDFTAYPEMACDVVGKNSSTPDGICNGLDYSVVKSGALARSSVPKDSNALVTDLDGDCQMSSADLSLLAQTLKERQDQQY